MHTIQAAITGLVQGLSEFLPVSSSAHITFSNELFYLISGTKIIEGVNQEEIFFDITAHLATLLAVIIYFFKDIKTIFINFFNSIKTRNYQNDDFKLTGYIILSTIITGIIGLFLKEKVESIITEPQMICVLLFITGIILFLSEKMYRGDKKISLKSTIIISIAQGLSVFPGFSRSGLTISAGLFLGMKRVDAAKFSFLISIPVIFLASLVYPIIYLDFDKILTFNLKAIITGFFVSFIVGYLCIKYFMKLLNRISLRGFSYYCFSIAILMFSVFQFYYH